MDQDRFNALIAKVVLDGKASLTDSEKAALQRFSSNWLREGDKVQRRVQHDAAPTSGVPDFSGTLASMDNGNATITLDEPVTISGPNGMTAQADEITVPLGEIEAYAEPDAPSA